MSIIYTQCKNEHFEEYKSMDTFENGDWWDSPSGQWKILKFAFESDFRKYTLEAYLCSQELIPATNNPFGSCLGLAPAAERGSQRWNISTCNKATSVPKPNEVNDGHFIHPLSFEMWIAFIMVIMIPLADVTRFISYILSRDLCLFPSET